MTENEEVVDIVEESFLDDEDDDVTKDSGDLLIEKKQRVQMINLDIQKLLAERDELEREIEYLEDDTDKAD